MEKLQAPASPLMLTCPQYTEAAPFLFSHDVLAEITKAESRGEYTAERLREQKPGIFRAIIEFRAQGVGQLKIAQVLGVHHRTVAAVDDAEPEAIDIVRQRLVRNLRRGAGLLVEQINEHPSLVPWHVKGMVMHGMLQDAELLDGRATVRTESAVRVDLLNGDDWENFLVSKLPAANAREIESGTGLEDRNVPAIGLEDRNVPAIEASWETGETTPRRPAADAESEGMASGSQVCYHDVTAFAPDRRAISQAQEVQREGAGGGSRPPEGTEPSTRSNPRNFSGNVPAPEDRTA